MQLALMDGGILMPVKKLDRIFNRDDVIELCFVDQIDDRRQRRALAAARRPGNQDDAILQFDYIAQLSGQIKVLEARRARRNHAHDDRMCTSLLENIDAKTTQTGNAET